MGVRRGGCGVLSHGGGGARGAHRRSEGPAQGGCWAAWRSLSRGDQECGVAPRLGVRGLHPRPSEDLAPVFPNYSPPLACSGWRGGSVPGTQAGWGRVRVGSQCWLAEECDWAEGRVGGWPQPGAGMWGWGRWSRVLWSWVWWGVCGGREVGGAKAHGRGSRLRACGGSPTCRCPRTGSPHASSARLPPQGPGWQGDRWWGAVRES